MDACGSLPAEAGSRRQSRVARPPSARRDQRLRGFRLQPEGCEVAGIWLTTCRRYLRRHARIGLASLVLRPARLAHHAHPRRRLLPAERRRRADPARRARHRSRLGAVVRSSRGASITGIGRGTDRSSALRPRARWARWRSPRSPLPGLAPDNAPEAQWLAAQREGREPWLDDLPAAFAAWLKDPPARGSPARRARGGDSA